MEKDDLIFKSNIYSIDSKNSKRSTHVEILYRIVEAGKGFFFAQEISTGTIFPVYSFTFDYTIPEDEQGLYFNFATNSYLIIGKYFVFGAISGKNNSFEYFFDVNAQKKSHELATITEVNNYLSKKRNNLSWLNKLQFFERKNKYFCDIEMIKRNITRVHSSDSTKTSPCSNFPKIRPCIDLSSISSFGYNLSEQQDLCNAIGREEEIKKIIKAIAIRGKSVILVGESGCGKTAIVEKIAKDIRNNNWLYDKVIFSLNTSSLVAGTKYRGDFEEKLNKIIDFCRNNRGKIILFIDEIHTLYKLGASDGNYLDAMNILKPYITNGDIIIIGATTNYEYKECITQDEAFCRRLEKIDIPTPDKKLNEEILLAYIKELEEKYQIEFNFSKEETLSIVNHLLNVSSLKHQTYIDSIKLQPLLVSQSIIDEAFAEARYNGQVSVGINDICYSITECSRIYPTIRKEEPEKLKMLFSSSPKVEEEKIIPFVKKLVPKN